MIEQISLINLIIWILFVTSIDQEYFVELWDIGGSHSQRNTRHVYMHVVHGIILVHDLTNRKSCLNLEKWLAEVMRAEAGSTMYSGAWDGANNDVGEVCIINDIDINILIIEGCLTFSPNAINILFIKGCLKNILLVTIKTNDMQFVKLHTITWQVSIPLLVVGTKVDEANGSRLPLHNRRSDIAEEYATEEIHLNCNDKTSIGPGTSAATKLARFFDKVTNGHIIVLQKS